MNLKVPVLPLRSATANMTEVERWVRLAGGLATPLVYVMALEPWLEGWWLAAAVVVLAAAAIDLVVSGIRGFCPLYLFVTMPWTPRLEAPASRLGDGKARGDEEDAPTPPAPRPRA